MYLAGKLSKFEVVDWIGRQSKHLRWWDMFVEDVTMDLLEGKVTRFHNSILYFIEYHYGNSPRNIIILDICHQVLDLYSQANNTKPPDSPPMIPSSEACRERPATVATADSATNTPNGKY